MNLIVVYIDVLFAVNLILNFILLWTTAKIARLKLKPWRILTGAMVASFYAVCMFFPDIQLIYTMLAKFIFSLVIIAITFYIKETKLFFKTVLIFYMVSFIFGGGAMALFSFTGVGASVGAVVSNGVLYFNLPWKLLFLSTGISYAIIRIVWKAYNMRLSKSNFNTKIKISLGNESAIINALVDTGNSLRDPLSDIPVMVTEYEKIKSLLPEQMKMMIDEGREPEDIALMLADTNFHLRLIPFSSVGKDGGLMLGFKPDSASVVSEIKERSIGEIIVGICRSKLTRDGSYNALLSPEILG